MVKPLSLTGSLAFLQIVGASFIRLRVLLVIHPPMPTIRPPHHLFRISIIPIVRLSTGKSAMPAPYLVLTENL